MNVQTKCEREKELVSLMIRIFEHEFDKQFVNCKGDYNAF